MFSSRGAGIAITSVAVITAAAGFGLGRNNNGGQVAGPTTTTTVTASTTTTTTIPSGGQSNLCLGSAGSITFASVRITPHTCGFADATNTGPYTGQGGNPTTIVPTSTGNAICAQNLAPVTCPTGFGIGWTISGTTMTINGNVGTLAPPACTIPSSQCANDPVGYLIARRVVSVTLGAGAIADAGASGGASTCAMTSPWPCGEPVQVVSGSGQLGHYAHIVGVVPGVSFTLDGGEVTTAGAAVVAIGGTTAIDGASNVNAVNFQVLQGGSFTVIGSPTFSNVSLRYCDIQNAPDFTAIGAPVSSPAWPVPGSTPLRAEQGSVFTGSGSSFAASLKIDHCHMHGAGTGGAEYFTANTPSPSVNSFVNNFFDDSSCWSTNGSGNDCVTQQAIDGSLNTDHTNGWHSAFGPSAGNTMVVQNNTIVMRGVCCTTSAFSMEETGWTNAQYVIDHNLFAGNNSYCVQVPATTPYNFIWMSNNHFSTWLGANCGSGSINYGPSGNINGVASNTFSCANLFDDGARPGTAADPGDGYPGPPFQNPTGCPSSPAWVNTIVGTGRLGHLTTTGN